MSSPRYVVGLDLGTTNSALVYADTGAESALTSFPVPQLVQPGQVAERPLLPSFLYLPGEKELPAGSLKLPWNATLDDAVGELARNLGQMIPTRLVSSAKSWLCHSGIDRRGPVLPWNAGEGVRRIAPLDACAEYLKHLRDAWNHAVAAKFPNQRLEQQEIVLTVPASFDAAARELTLEAARLAGLETITLLEEPQAAFYAWIDACQDAWREQVEVGDVVLVCDVGGGTTDFTLIAVSEEKGNLVLTRVAVGDHILLGGDNMDLALAHHLARQLAAAGTKLDAGQMQMLWHSARMAKETLLGDAALATAPVTVLGRGSKVIGGTIKTELKRADLEQVLVEGFFPDCALDTEPQRQRAAGFQELGLPYAADAAITRHLAYFLSRNADYLAQHAAPKKKRGGAKSSLPTAILFNGGVFKAQILRDRLVAVANRWAKQAGAAPVRVLENPDLDLAVSRGAAYYGLVRRGKGVRIRGGTARSYYVGIESALPAVPGAPPPLKALCVVPFGMEEGTEADVPGQEFGLIVGEPATFRFLGSSVRREDVIGTLVEDWHDQIEELAPISATLDAPGKEGRTVPVHLHAKVTEIGTLELWCLGKDAKQRWKLEFNVRDSGD